MPNEEIVQEPLFSDEEGDSAPYLSMPTLEEREVFTTPIDPDVRTILGQIEDDSLILHPQFQRAVVWDHVRQSRLIESLFLNLPIPPCFFAEDELGTRVVVDGQQRLAAIDQFYKGHYALEGLQVLSGLNGKRWTDLEPKLKRKMLQRVIRTLVISHFSHPDIRYEIFERLNTGGEPLTEQEIRNATLRGEFNDMLDALAHSDAFRNALNVREPDVRLRHHELILRYFAIHEALNDYVT
jgi:hypothetical protein